MGKYANGDGSIYKWMKDGKVIRDEGAVTYTGDDGKTKRHTVYGPARQDVRDKLRTSLRAARRRRTGQGRHPHRRGLAGRWRHHICKLGP